MEIHQFLESFSDGDAIGYHALAIRKLLEKNGIKSKIFANNIDEKQADCCQHFQFFGEEQHKKNTILVFHHSIYSKALEYFQNLPYKKIVIFHNITPPEFFEKNLDFKKLLELGYKQIRLFNKLFVKASADSSFNKLILRENGYGGSVNVIPPFVNLKDKFNEGINKWVKAVSEKEKNIKIIFVSQFGPHKRQDDLIKSFKVYKNIFNPKSKLYLIGGFNPNDTYYQSLKRLSSGDEGIIFTGKISLDELVRYFKTADLFLCLSEHEGFAVPLVEAMYFGVKIIAYNAGAVEETLGGGGVLLNNKDPLTVAATIDRIIKDKSLGITLLENQKKQLEKFSFSEIETKWKKFLIKK